MEEHKGDDVIKYQDEIRSILKNEIISRYYYQKGKIIASLSEDKEIAKAIDIVTEKDNYIAILDGQSSDTESN